MLIGTPEVPSAVERILRRDRMLMASGVLATAAVAWIYLVDAAGDMQMHAAMGMSADWLGLFVMWAVMMGAMMLPSAAPVILLVLGVYRRRGNAQARLASVAFGAGYLLAWTTFSAAAATAQIGLHRAALLSADMRLNSGVFAGAVLLAAGAYQWLPVKNACLTACQSPLGFLSRYWREGVAGGLMMGARHGVFCVGCCWLLMALLFVVGVMNLLWVALLTGFVLVEKLLRIGPLVPRVAGVAMGTWGAYLLASSI